MKAGGIFVLGALAFMASCIKDENPVADFYTLDSKQSLGFSFESHQIIGFPNDSGISPDFILLTETNESGNLLAPFLSHPNLENRFALIGQFKDLETAAQFFDTYTVPKFTIMQQFAFNIKAYQVWLIKTSKGNYGKLMIVEAGEGIYQSTPYSVLKFRAEKF